MRNQANSQDQLKNDGKACNNEGKIQAEKMVAIDVNLEAIHVDNLQDSRHDKYKSQKDFQGRFTDRIWQPNYG